MPQTVNVPNEITREQLLEVVRTLGLGESLADLSELHINRGGIRAVVFAKDERGQRYFAGATQKPATHTISIPLARPTE